ncbi:class I adenylate cyclase [Maridesulfovibrio sp.]|uniref:class I adenylate cyclase n=1 Tax=Maridesulfovibrio sp. TaxID=2795000 RepID=UPI0029F502D5|nr:class I adenylate cyclase [Maridesulfovibrio sp.]
MAAIETHDTLLDELRRLTLYPPEERQLAELRYKLEGKFSRAENNPEGLEAAKYGVLLHAMAIKAIVKEAEDSSAISYSPDVSDSTAAICLDYLAQMGICGRNLAALILCHRALPFSRVKEWFASQQDETAIAVADRLLVVNPGDVPERIKFARSQLDKVSELSILESMSFFSRNGTRKGELSLHTLGKFMTGNYGKTCREKLHNPDSLEEISSCTETMPPYPDREIVKDISFHLKTMDPIIMEKVLRAVERLADEIDDDLLKEIMPLAKSPSLPLAKAGMDIMVKFGGTKRGRIFVQLFNEAPKLRAELINRVPLLNSDSFARFMKEIPSTFHVPVLAVLFSTISEEDPQCFGNILSNVLKQSRSNKAGGLKALLVRTMETEAFNEPPRPEMIAGKSIPGVDFIKSGGPIVLNIEKKEQESTGFKRIFGKNEVQSDGLPDIYTDGQITNQRLHKLNKWKSISQGLTFQNCTFEACELRDAFMEECSFKGCVFEACSFADAVFLESKFTNCTFKNSSLNGSIFYDCSLKDCIFQNSHFDSAVTFLSEFKSCSFKTVATPKAYFCRTRFLTCLFDICDFRGTYFYKGTVKACDFNLSDFNSALFKDSSVAGSNFEECSMKECQAMNVKTNSPELLKSMQRYLAHRLNKRENLKKRSIGFGKTDEYSRGVLYKAIKRWFVLKDIERNQTLFTDNNKRRLDWAASKLNKRGRIFLQILPALLHTNIFEIKSGMDSNGSEAKISNYEITSQTAELLENVFPELKYEESRIGAIPIEAFMSIGSTGTIAQTADSDLDSWVCCDFRGISSDRREKLNEKLQKIEEWAQEEFALEIHFFTMDVREVRNNQFGLSDEESSGSAQSAILKEEFYRTALLLAGKPPLWWFSPPEADDRTYENCRKRIRLLKGKSFCVDLGNIPNIPMEEFFGASLWQIVKGIKSPFKAIMKFGLLELYTSDSKYSLLCEKLKKNVQQGSRSIFSTDPYMLLYQELAEFYTKRDQDEKAWLTAMALRLKCGLVGENKVEKDSARPEDIELVEFNVNLSQKSPQGMIDGFNNLSDFSSVTELGKQINQFMVNTYMKVRGEQEKFPGVAITPEDLTRLGRVIFSAFARRKDKILRLSLPGPKTHFFNTIIISRSENEITWHLQGEYMDESGSRKIQTKIESGKDLNFMLVWLALNRLYNREMQIKTDISSGPLREREVKKLIQDLMVFFPEKDTFNIRIEETLNTERITKGFFIVNLCIPPENKRIQEVHFVYSTNWGEVFCKQLKVNRKLIETPEQYLKDDMGSLYHGEIELGQFLPSHAECPFLKIPVRLGH